MKISKQKYLLIVHGLKEKRKYLQELVMVLERLSAREDVPESVRIQSDLVLAELRDASKKLEELGLLMFNLLEELDNVSL